MPSTAREQTKQNAASGAKKLCGIGWCKAPFICNHKNKAKATAEKPKGYCPLAKYEVEPDLRSPSDIPEKESKITSNELFALCSRCIYGENVQRMDLMNDEIYYLVYRKDPICCVCPAFTTNNNPTISNHDRPIDSWDDAEEVPWQRLLPNWENPY